MEKFILQRNDNVTHTNSSSHFKNNNAVKKKFNPQGELLINSIHQVNRYLYNRLITKIID